MQSHLAGGCPQSGGASLCCDGCFHASPVGASSCAQRARSPGMRALWVCAHSTAVLLHPCQHLVEGNTRSCRISARPPQTTNSPCAELHHCWRVASGGTEVHEQRASSHLAAGSTRVAARDHRSLNQRSSRFWLHSQQVNEEEKITSQQ